MPPRWRCMLAFVAHTTRTYEHTHEHANIHTNIQTYRTSTQITRHTYEHNHTRQHAQANKPQHFQLELRNIWPRDWYLIYLRHRQDDERACMRGELEPLMQHVKQLGMHWRDAVFVCTYLHYIINWCKRHTPVYDICTTEAKRHISMYNTYDVFTSPPSLSNAFAHKAYTLNDHQKGFGRLRTSCSEQVQLL